MESKRISAGVDSGFKRDVLYNSPRRLLRYHAVTQKMESIVKIPDREQSFGVYGAFLEATDFLAMGPDGDLLVVHDQRSSQLYAMKRQSW